MESLPNDILTLICLELPPNYLMLNKTFLSLYNSNNYCKLYLQNYYPNIKLPNKDYEELYKKSLMEGDIYVKHCFYNHDNRKFNIRGIKACGDNTQLNDYILKFNGDLLRNNKNGNITLVDSDVKDLDDEFYIKKNNLYLIAYNDTTNLIVESPENFNSIHRFDVNHSVAVCATTNNIIYLYKRGDLTNKKFGYKILNAKINEFGISILFENNILKFCDFKFDPQYIINHVTELIGDSVFKRENIYYKFINEPITKYSKNNFIEIPNNYGDILSSVRNFYLTQKGLVKCLPSGEYELIEETNKIKRIYGNYVRFEIHW